MKYSSLFILSIVALSAAAQQQTYDVLTFTPPKGWSKTSLKNVIGFSTTDQVNGTWAQISIVSSTSSKGSIESDFQNEWNDLAVKPYAVSQQPLAIDKQRVDGWNVWSGSGAFQFQNQTANLILCTLSDGQRCMSFTMMSNTTTYGPLFDAFLESIHLPATSTKNESLPVASTTSAVNVVSSSPATSDGFYFGTTNFDDGWTSVVKEDWVEATKGNVKVLLHYPRKEDSEYISQQDAQTRLFWNLLVAPRYVSATELFIYNYNSAYQPGHFASAYLTDKGGKTQFVALFMRAKSGWIEIITPDKDTFVKNFGVDQPDSSFDKWDALFNLSGLNRFAVHENDLKGKWSSDFSGSMQYYNSYTGMYAGYNAYASNETFVFSANKSYNWKISSANTVNGQTQAQGAESSGTFSMKGNWQVFCSKIQNDPKTYNAYFSCVKGGRILWLQDVEYGNYTAYGKSAQ